MAEFIFLAFYKDHPSDMANMKSRGSNGGYEKLPKRTRGTSVCTTLPPVMEDETEEVQKKVKRRFSLDFLFSKKKKKSVLKDNGKRGSLDSSVGLECNNATLNPDYNRRNSSANSAEIYSYCFS